MTCRMRFLLSLLVLQGCASPDPAPGVPDPRQPFPASASDEFGRTLDGVVAAGVAPGVSVTVDHPSYRPWSGASGVANIQTGEALTQAKRFRAGSVLKTAIATAVLQLVERNELALEHGLTELLPSVAMRIPDSNAITLRMLLNHTSGLPEFSTPEQDQQLAADPTRIWTFDELLDNALRQPRGPAPGSAWFYSNTNYILLGKILDETTGEPWRKIVRERVLERAKLEKSELPEDGDARCNACSRAYHPIDDQLVDLTEVDPSMAGASGGSSLITTPADLATLLKALFEGQLFDDPATLRLMLDFVDAPIPEEAQTGYGLGLQHFQTGEIALVGHLGGTAGFHCFVFHHAETGMTASGFMNRHGDLGAFILPVLEAMTKIK